MTEPSIGLETDFWVLLVKPHDMPTAPLSREDEEATLLGWFLSRCPEARQVTGKKTVEYGLLHRLDTGTSGLVLVAKNQDSYDRLYKAQQGGHILKTYFAFCLTPETHPFSEADKPPFTVRSRFRAWGPGRKEVRPLFPGMKGYESAGKDYETVIEKVESGVAVDDAAITGITCTLSRGFRHQIRTHLAFYGYPIAGDPLYSSRTIETGTGERFPLQLYATGISFSDPFSKSRVSFSIPQPDRMSR
jgi:23S rRNA pseudouridine1911/1915/1917 synthase